MSQSFDLTGPSVTSHINFNGADCEKVMLNGTRIWERYITQGQVWVTSGYNSTQEVWVAEHYSWWYSGNGTRWGTWGYHDVYHTWSTSMGLIPGNTYAASRTWNGYTWKHNGSSFWLGNSGARHYGINQYQDQAIWVDTSGYETQNVTAYYY
jgi:hypothetical protein